MVAKVRAKVPETSCSCRDGCGRTKEDVRKNTVRKTVTDFGTMSLCNAGCRSPVCQKIMRKRGEVQASRQSIREICFNYLFLNKKKSRSSTFALLLTSSHRDRAKIHHNMEIDCDKLRMTYRDCEVLSIDA